MENCECFSWVRTPMEERNNRLPDFVNKQIKIVGNHHPRCKSFKIERFFIVREDCDNQGEFFICKEEELFDQLSNTDFDFEFYAVVPIKMTIEEYESLPEFDGF